MKSTSSTFLDKRVILTMIACIVLSLFILAFRFKFYEPYVPVEIAVKNGKINCGEIIRFVADTKNGSTHDFEWDYGDRSPHGKGEMATHTFKAPGKYDIVLQIDGKYREYKNIYISEVPQNIQPRPSIVRNSEVRPATEIIPTAFKGKEKKKDNRLKVATIPGQPPLPPPIDTVGKVPPAKPAEVTVLIAPDISEVEMELMLRQIVSGHREVNDFSPYLCGNVNMQVMYNDREMPFGQMCGELIGEMKKVKRISALTVSFSKDPITNCIKQLSVTAKKKKWF